MYKNPVPTVDVIIEMKGPAPKKIVLIKRKNPPFGWALPGGFVDYGESLEEAAVREAHEETSLRVRLIRQFHTYSDPARDARQHNITTVYIAEAEGNPAGRDDASEAAVFGADGLPEEMAFDHRDIISDYLNDRWKN